MLRSGLPHVRFLPTTDPEQRWVLNYSSWISPELFGPTFVDVTALSHEIAETYNDPFVVSDNVHNLTPFWLAPNGNCGDVLETGDVIEGLPNATFPVNLNGFLYHPQNEGAYNSGSSFNRHRARWAGRTAIPTPQSCRNCQRLRSLTASLKNPCCSEVNALSQGRGTLVSIPFTNVPYTSPFDQLPERKSTGKSIRESFASIF
jgi:hypothetical protein